MNYYQTELAKVNLLLEAFGVRPTTTTSFAVAETLVELDWRRKEWDDKADDYGLVRSEAVRQLDLAEAKMADHRVDPKRTQSAHEPKKTP